MMGKADAERLRAQGIDVETIGDILDQLPGQPEPEPEPQPFTMAVLDGYPVDFPEPGIYFGMDEDAYHAIPALSTSGIKMLAASPMLYWAKTPWLNPEWAELKREEEERRRRLGQDHFDIGHAYHCRILEGREAFAARFVPALDRADYPDALVTVDDIKAAFPEGIKPKGKSKREVFEHLRSLDGTAELWDDIKAAHEAEHEGKCFVPAKVIAQLEKAAAMIERDPELNQALTGGYPEVSLFWRCPRTGVPMKARADYLKIKAVVDLKTVQNSHEESIENAIRRDIANRRYAVQPSVYLEGVEVVRKLVSEAYGRVEGSPDQLKWAGLWSLHRGDTEWLWIYQQKGVAPVARGLFYPTRGSTKAICDGIVSMMKGRLRQFSDAFGCDPWIDSKPIYDLADEDLPPWATDI